VAAADDLSGVTEVRPGNYLFFDAFQVAIGSCTLDEPGVLGARDPCSASTGAAELRGQRGSLRALDRPGPST